MLDEEFESDREEVLFAEMEPLTRERATSMLDDELERLLELVLIAAKVASRLEDDDDRLRDDVCEAAIEVFVPLSAASMLLELEESERLEV
jgi:hypothetical protein